MSNQKIWYMDIEDFFSLENLSVFFPNKNQAKEEQLNSVFRFSLYLSVLFYLYNRNENVFVIPLLVGVYTIATYKIYKKSTKEDEFKNYAQFRETQRRHPTIDNPYMNPNLITKESADVPARDVLSKETQKEIQHLFDLHAVKDSKDLFQTNNANQRFYTVPSTTIPNRQDEFAKFLYGDMKSRKQVFEY